MGEEDFLSIALLGELRLTAGGVQIDISPAPARIVAWVAVQPTRGGSRVALCRDLWPDLDDRAGRARLSQGLWKIRQQLADGPDLLDVSDRNVRLHDSVVTDVDRIRSLSALPSFGAKSVDVDWDGIGRPLCEDWDEEWIVEARTELSRALDRAMVRQAEALAARHDHHGALRLATKRTQLFPHDEASWRALIALNDQMGDVAEASRNFAMLTEKLLEVGVAPSADLVAAQEHRVVGSAANTTLVGGSRLVGRGAERAELIKLLEAATAGFGATVILEGESGVGKSRLIEQFVSDANWRGIRLGQAQCSNLDAPLASISRAIEAAVAPIEVAALSDSLDKPWLWRAAALLSGLEWPPELREIGPNEPSLSGGEDERQVQCLVEVVVSIGHRRPVCLVLDDLNVADRWTMSAVRRLTELVGDLPVLVLVAFRTDQTTQVPPEELQQLDAMPHARRISLQGLNLRGTYELARELDERITRSTAQKLMVASRGNPLIIRHLADQFEASEIDHMSGGSMDPDPIVTKLRTVSPLEAEIIDVLAVAEESLGVFSLASVCGSTSPELVADAVLALVGSGLVLERRGRYETAHDRVRVAALESITPSSLQRIASSLIRLREGGTTPVAAARLATRASDWTRAVAAHRIAGSDALRIGAVAAASEHLRAAAEAGRLAGLDDDEMADLLLALHDAYVLDGETDWERETLDRLRRLRARDRWEAIELRTGWRDLDDGSYTVALATAQRLIDRDSSESSFRGTAHRLRAEVRLATGQGAEALRELRRSLEADDGSRPTERAELLIALANVQVTASDGDLGAKALQAAIPVLERAELVDQLVDAKRQFGMLRVHSGETQEGLDSLYSALSLAKRLGDKRRQAQCQGALGAAVFVLLDRYGSGRPHVLQALDLATATRDFELMAKAANNLGFGDAVILGRVGSGVDLLEQAIEWASAERSSFSKGLPLFSRAEVAFRMDDEESALELYGAAERAIIESGSGQPLENVLADSAVLRARIGDFAAADHLVDRSKAAFRTNSHGEAAALLEASFAEVCSLRGDPVGALGHAAQVAKSFRPGVHERHYHLLRASRIFRTHGADQEADVHLGLAVLHLRRCIADFEPALRSEVAAHNALLLREGAALSERCAIIAGDDVATATPAGIRLEVRGDELARLGERSADRATVFAAITSLAREANMKPSLSCLAETFNSPVAGLQREFDSLKGVPRIQFVP